jgi:hypothetical protein
VFLDAWLSLGAQVHLLMGTHGLLPIAPLLDAARGEVSYFRFPTHLWLAASDGALTAWVALGVLLALAALAGLAPRILFGASALLYLGFAVAGRTFTSFQWDNMLVECGVLAAFLPAQRRAPLAHLAFRLLLFKLYFESGIAKAQSPIGDWLDGSAMTYYYETAPLPTALAWYAHHMPTWWHHLESWGALVLELLVPLLFFAGRRARLAAAGALTAFQLVNLLTANYGFFVYLTLALHLFLLDDGDVAWLVARLRRPVRAASDTSPRLVRVGALLLAVYAMGSAIEGYDAFARPGPGMDGLAPLREAYAPFRVLNVYHLFAAITRDRIEPELESSPDGVAWAAHPLRHKPGPVARRPDWVAPHQPRVDFQLWFYGLAFRRAPSAYVSALEMRLCEAPALLLDLLAEPPPPRPRAVRIAFYAYHFSSPEEKRASGAWWVRTRVGATPARACGEAPPPGGPEVGPED